MGASLRGFITWAVGVGAVVLAGCGGSGNSRSPAATASRPGTAGQSYYVTVTRPTGGTISSGDGRIDCGTTTTRCGPATYAWTEIATLTATADPGFMLGTWIGDCTGRPLVNGQYVCSLDTTRYGADKWVGAVFGAAGRTQHPNFTDPAVHGQAFRDWIARAPDAYECTYCHGANYEGGGIALSCNACHANAGYADWRSTCNFCHGAPPAPPPTGRHPVVSSDLTTCTRCHAGTVDGTGTLVPGGLHMNGHIDGGHQDGYVAVAVHGRDFLGSITNGASSCSACHGAAFDAPIVAGGQSCTSCHAAQGWSGWQTNCSFCHGRKDDTTKAGYVLADHPTWSAPPDGVSERLTGVAPSPDPTGAHTAHLTAGRYGRAFACGVCHEVPTTVAHVSGGRADVVVQPPWKLDPEAGYSTITRSCATSCHGAGGSPAWNTRGLQCSGCHGVPPATPAHGPILTTTDLTLCNGCHPTTIDATGALILPAGTHLNGTVDSVDGHPDTPEPFYVASVHGPQYLNYVAGVQGAANCTTCHGAALTYCTSCHSTAFTRYGDGKVNWVSWQTNCTFCHGTRQATYSASLLPYSAPGDTITSRVGVASATNSSRLGRHASHVFDGTNYHKVPCGACHPIPTDLSHVSAARKATVTFSAAAAFPELTPAELAALPDPIAVYTAGSPGRCSGYCHGSPQLGGDPTGVRSSGTNPRWTSLAALQPNLSTNCTACHGQPPATGKAYVDQDCVAALQACYDDCIVGGGDAQSCTAGCANGAASFTAACTTPIHSWHAARAETANCYDCHTYPGSAPPGTAVYLQQRHVNGVKDIGGVNGADVGWNPATRSCSAPDRSGVACHGGTPRYWNQ